MGVSKVEVVCVDGFLVEIASIDDFRIVGGVVLAVEVETAEYAKVSSVHSHRIGMQLLTCVNFNTSWHLFKRLSGGRAGIAAVGFCLKADASGGIMGLMQRPRPTPSDYFALLNLLEIASALHNALLSYGLWVEEVDGKKVNELLEISIITALDKVNQELPGAFEQVGMEMPKEILEDVEVIDKFIEVVEIMGMGGR